MFSLLASRSEYSIGESILTTDSLIDTAKALGQTAVAMTDTMSITGLVNFAKKASLNGIKPIVGARLRISENALWRQAKGEKKKNMPKAFFVTFYVRSEVGLKALYRLLSLANDADHFYYHSKLNWTDVTKEVSGLTAADYALVLGDEQGIYQHAQFHQIIDDIVTFKATAYLPFIAVNTPYYGTINKRSMELHKQHGLPILAIRPALYGVGEADVQEVMTAVCENTQLSSGVFRSRFNRNLHPMGLRDFIEEVKACGKHLVARGVVDAGVLAAKAIQETTPFVSAITYEWKKQPPSLPRLATDEFAKVVEECKKGFTERFSKPMFGHTPTQSEQLSTYLPRLKYELGVLEKLGFSPYFLTVQDIVNHAKSNNILVGPGRGSVGGSLVAYLMGITDIDPIRFGLLFERFINPERLDLPDADLDFMSTHRHDLVDYLINKFGSDKVAGVSNINTLGAASALRDIARLVGLPESEYSVSKLVPKVHGQNVSLESAAEQVAEIKAFSLKYPQLWPIITRLQGSVRNLAQHAAGIVVADKPLNEFAVVESRSEVVVNWDKWVIEEQGLVKIDLLGLTTLDVIGLALKYIKENTGKTVEINQIPLNDPEVLKAFAEGKTTGIFQFESGGMKKLLRDLGSLTGTVTFDDITACTALYRPGPMESGMMDSFARRKRGDETIDYDHPLMESFLKETFGVMVYQEQVMRASQVIAGYTGPEADKLRKIMGKKQPEEMAKQRDKFVQGCVRTVGSTEQWAGALFDKIEGFAGYGFNKSHASAYSLISYQTMWLKVNYPLAFYAASMTMMGQDKLISLLRDAKNQGVTITFPDINRSTDRFEIDQHSKEVIIPFQRVKGISGKGAEAIVTARAGGRFASKQNFINRVEKRLCNIRSQETLDKVGAFASIEPMQMSANDPRRLADQVELLPGLVNAYVPVNREMHRDSATKDGILKLVDEYRHAHGPATGDALPCKPHIGRNMRVMIVTDAPGKEEEGSGSIGLSRSNMTVVDAMLDADLVMADVYWTSIIKRPKSKGQVTADEISAYRPYFQREIEILKPTVIVLLGSQAARTMIPGLKGRVSDMAGEVIYFKDLDANVVIGFSPGQIYHNPELQDDMNKVFVIVKELLS